MEKNQFSELISVLDKAKVTEIASAVFLFISVVVALVVVFYARKQLISDHLRSQRQVAVDLCIKWSEFIAPETSSVTRMIERLTQEQLDAVSNITSLKISIKYKHDLINILQLRFPDIEKLLETSCENDAYRIEGRHLQHIRYIAVRYLNMLESVLLAWAEGIADHKTIVKEFAYILDESDNSTAMESFRRKIGFDDFPSIAMFIQALRTRSNEDLKSVKRPSIV